MGAPDRALVDLDDLVEHVDAVDALVVAGLGPHLVEPVCERLVEDLVHERGLSGAGDTRDGDEPADREVDVDPLQVVHRRPANGEPAAPSSSRRGGTRIRRSPLRNRPDRAGRRRDGVGCPFADDLASVLPAPGPRSTTQSASASFVRRARRRAPCCRRRGASRACR